MKPNTSDLIDIKAGPRRIALLGVGLLAFMQGCFYVPPSDSLGNHFHTRPPAGVQFVHYYSDAFKDPQFLWILSPINQTFLNDLIKNAKLQPVVKGKEPTRGLGSHIATWWDFEKIEAIPELYYREPDPNDGSYYRIWVDREANRMYVLFSNT